MRIVGTAVAALSLLVAGMAAAPAQGSPSRAPGGHVPAIAASSGRVAASGAIEVDAPVPDIEWQRCGQLRCAWVPVPLDYDKPNGRQTTLFMAKRRADDSSRKIGTLFVNPGGPGGPSSEAVEPFARELGKRVRTRFDIIGVDPRGTSYDNPVMCRTPRLLPSYPYNSVPLNLKQAKPTFRFNRALRAACRTGGTVILDHMTTADTARDMDLIRQAVGDNRLSYYGISYGSYLGSTYAAMFPDRVRALVVDGVLDPVAWATGRHGTGTTLPFSTRLGSGVGAWEALTAAFDECNRVGEQRCELSGHAHRRWGRIMDRLREGPFVAGPGERFTYAGVVSGVLGSLYSLRGTRSIMRPIDQLYDEMFEPQTGVARELDLAGAFRSAVRRAPGPYASALAPAADLQRAGDVAYPTFEGVACSDTVNPQDPRAWLRASTIADRRGPWFGRLWTFASSACPHWPGSGDDAFRGPWRVATSNPLLVVGNLHDPATPISGARVVNGLFPGSRLLTLDTWAHGAIGQSDCVKTRMSDYLVSGQLPAEGKVCRANHQLFPVRP